MVIEFPKKYSVKKVGIYNAFYVTVPSEYVKEMTELIAKQAWISAAYPPDTIESFYVMISDAYEVSEQQAHDALCRLCEHVMSPPVDMAVWGEALGGTESDAPALAD